MEKLKFIDLFCGTGGFRVAMERVIIVGHIEPILFSYPSPVRPFKPLSDILEKKVDKKYIASDYIKEKRKSQIGLQTFHLA